MPTYQNYDLKKLSVTRPRSESEMEKKMIGLAMVIKSARIDEKVTKIYRNPKSRAVICYDVKRRI